MRDRQTVINGSTVEEIGAGAPDIPYLITIVISENNEAYSFVSGILYDEDVSILIRFLAAKQVIVIPETVISIGYNAFAGSNVEALKLADGTALIGASPSLATA